MSKVVNIKIGQGRINPAGGIIQNQIKQWNATGDNLTLKDLIDRPEYYLGKISKTFNIPYTRAEHLKDPFNIEHQVRKTINNPGSREAARPKVSQLTLQFDRAKKGNLKAAVAKDTRDYIQQYYNNFYRISYFEENGNEKISRPVRYYYTSEEIQTIIDEDLISGKSGFLVSKLGDLDEPRFGPFMLQSKSKGFRNNLFIRPEFQTDPTFISGSIGGFLGSEDTYANLHLGYSKTGTFEIQVSAQSKDVRHDALVQVGASYRIYDLRIGALIDNSRNSIMGSFTKKEDDTPDGFICSGGYWEPPQQMVVPTKVFKDYVTLGMNVHFNDYIDYQNTEAPLKIIGANPVVKNQRILHNFLFKNADVPQVIFSDKNQYNVLNCFQYGAPYSFWGHKYDRFKAIVIKNQNALRSFRIHPANAESVSRDCQILELTNNPNLSYMWFDPRAFGALSKFNVSGCNLDFLNDMAWAYTSGHSTTKPFGINQKRAWRGRYKTPPVHARCKYHNLNETDFEKDELFPAGALPYFITNFNLKNVNLNNNRFNQTGIYAALQACLFSKRKMGFFDGRNQKHDESDPLAKAVFYTGVHEYPIGKITGRFDVYQMNPFRQENLDYALDQYQSSSSREEASKKVKHLYFFGDKPVYDLNKAVLTSANALRARGWKVLLDYTDEKFKYPEGSAQPNWAAVDYAFRSVVMAQSEVAQELGVVESSNHEDLRSTLPFTNAEWRAKTILPDTPEAREKLGMKTNPNDYIDENP